MKFHLVFVLLIVLVSSYVTPVSAQETADANRRLDELRTELHQAQDRKAELMIRLEQLNFDLRPENIERHFNGFGSTHPEELRESRRRQLQTEKDRVVVQLEQLQSSCTRLEAEVNTAQANLYHQQATTVAMKTNPNPDRLFFIVTRVMIPLAILCAILCAIAFGRLIRSDMRRGQPGD
jgi:uncharacterized protein YlxW (UPF0749 family)